MSNIQVQKCGPHAKICIGILVHFLEQFFLFFDENEVTET